jgi:hypothetical protein
MPAPHEVVAAPLEIWLAPTGTTFPAIDAAPGVGWALLGTEGDLNYDDDGVTISHSEEVSDFKPAGSTMPTKRFRTGEALEMKLNLVDVSPDEYAKVMNNATVTDVAASSGIAGESSFSLFRGDQVNQFAVLARGMSSVDNTLTGQYEFSKAFVSVDGDVQWKKGDPAALPVKILAVRTSDTDVLIYRVQTAPAS